MGFFLNYHFKLSFESIAFFFFFVKVLGKSVSVHFQKVKTFRARLIAHFKQLFEHFKHIYTHFYIFFHPHIYQKHSNNITQTPLLNIPLYFCFSLLFLTNWKKWWRNVEKSCNLWPFWKKKECVFFLYF